MIPHSQRVLVIDDEADIRESVCRWLNSEGYDTSTAEDGEQGVESAIQQQPDVILLDVLMPNKDGLETLAELRAHNNTRMIPVVMLSASLRDEQRTLDAGANFFVYKPYEGKILLSMVNTVLKKKVSQPIIVRP